jgi:hypothetical protein
MRGWRVASTVAVAVPKHALAAGGVRLFPDKLDIANVVPAKAGTQSKATAMAPVDSRFRGKGDERYSGNTLYEAERTKSKSVAVAYVMTELLWGAFS